ncbi:MAG: hypothetical protein KC502_15685 [Myxococcales bacterium]|nr:hypothetical protein [Myxococcales bacterium]
MRTQELTDMPLILIALTVFGVALVALVMLTDEPSMAQTPPKPVVRQCSPAAGADGPRAQAFRTRVAVDGIACISCAGPLLMRVANEPGVCAAQLQPNGDMLVDYQPTVVDITRVLDVIDGAGFKGQAWSEGSPIR